jgi:hypothetical protein
MSSPDEQVFWDTVDAFIEQANSACERMDPSAASAALMHAAARFSAFVVASSSLDRKEYIEEMKVALNYLTDQYRELLRADLEDYRENYKIYIKVDEDS